MTKNSSKKQNSKSKIEKLQSTYGKDNGNATLQETSTYLKSKGYSSLGQYLTSSTNARRTVK